MPNDDAFIICQANLRILANQTTISANKPPNFKWKDHGQMPVNSVFITDNSVLIDLLKRY